MKSLEMKVYAPFDVWAADVEARAKAAAELAREQRSEEDRARSELVTMFYALCVLAAVLIVVNIGLLGYINVGLGGGR